MRGDRRDRGGRHAARGERDLPGQRQRHRPRRRLGAGRGPAVAGSEDERGAVGRGAPGNGAGVRGGPGRTLAADGHRLVEFRRGGGRGPAGQRGAADRQRERRRGGPGRGQGVAEGHLRQPQRIADPGPAERGGEHVRATVGRQRAQRDLVRGAGGVGDRHQDRDGGAYAGHGPGPALGVERGGQPYAVRPAAQLGAAGLARGRDGREQPARGQRRLVAAEQDGPRRLSGVDGQHLRGQRLRRDVGGHRVLHTLGLGERADRPWRQRAWQVCPHVGAGRLRRLVVGGLGPAPVLGERERPGGHRHHQQQRGAALAQRLPAELPAGQRRGQLAAAGGQPVPAAGRGGQQAQHDHRAAGQRERGGEDEHRVDARRAAPAARRDGRVAAQLPAGQHGERDQARDPRPRGWRWRAPPACRAGPGRRPRRRRRRQGRAAAPGRAAPRSR